MSKGQKCCQIDWHGRCCCNCKFHVEDFHHCTTTGQVDGQCVCSFHKGWICMPPEMDRVYSDWGDHGMCEMHDFKVPPVESPDLLQLGHKPESPQPNKE